MQVTKEVVSLSEMARMLGFSRARFYQLLKEGVLPKPTKTDTRARPFFNREQQEQCLTVRRTNCGINGKAILFYAMRSSSTPPRVRPRGRPRRPAPRSSASINDPTIRELCHGLLQLGLADVTERNIRTALVDLYPDGHAGVESAELLRSVFGHLNRQNTDDNVS